jgi:hypothetical protein
MAALGRPFRSISPRHRRQRRDGRHRAGVKRALAETNAVEQVVRVCRHRAWHSGRVCYVDRSRPPTVCHHLRNSSRRDCY